AHQTTELNGPFLTGLVDSQFPQGPIQSRKEKAHRRREIQSPRDSGSIERESVRARMFRRGRFLSLPLVVGAVLIGVVSGKAIFGPPLDEYWRKKLQEEAAKNEGDARSS
ncbi:hypothetical protein Ancab_003924, partial [Ancistrocladus abbreviatus]